MAIGGFGPIGSAPLGSIPETGPVVAAPFKPQLGAEHTPPVPYRLTIDYSQSLNLLLIQQAAATIIPRQWDWPNPRPPVYPVHQLVPNLLTSTLGFVQAPFIPSDWSIPQVPRRGQEPQDSPNPGLTTRAAVPFLSKDWPNPIVGRATFGDAVVNLHLNTLAVPFSQTEWFNPPNPIRITPSHEAPSLLITTLTPIVADPFVSMAWHYDRPVIHPQQPAPQHNETLMLLDRSLVPDPNTRTALYAKRTGSPAVYWKGRG